MALDKKGRVKKKGELKTENENEDPDRWIQLPDRVFQGQYLRNLSINYAAINKHLEKLPLQLY